MKVICKCLGGSHSYGLNTPSSDVDIRGVFLNTDYKHILGIDTEDHIKEKEGDQILFELRRFVQLLAKGNTGALEVLFNRNWIEKDSMFDTYFTNCANRFVDSVQLYKCLSGYAQHELRLALGMRPGTIGHKRCEQVKQYGFSPKNFCQLFRLMMVGTHFFNSGEFIVDCRNFKEPGAFDFLMQVKTQPETYTVGKMERLFDDYKKAMDLAFENRGFTFKFDHNHAAEVILAYYYPHLREAYEQV